MWGADDPDCRKPVIWNDIVYEDEHANYNPDVSRPVDVVRQDTGLLSFYRGLCKMRKENPVLAIGDLTFLVADDKKMVLVYNRTLNNDEIIVAFNRSNDPQSVKVPVRKEEEYIGILPGSSDKFKNIDNGIEIRLEPLTAIVLKKKQ